MYSLLAKQLISNRVYKYTLKDIASGELAYVDNVEFKGLVRQNKVKDVSLANNRLYGKGLRCPLEDIFDITRMLTFYTCTQLTVFASQAKYFKARSELESLLINMRSNQHAVSIIHGTRRTGKTVLMQQALLKLNTENSCYISLHVGISFAELYSFLEKHCLSYKYIFIDEITNCTDLINNFAKLSDFFCTRISATEFNRRLVLTGTDSYVLTLACATTLYGRYTAVSTTTLLYSDYNNLFNKSFKDYYKSVNLLENYDLSLTRDLLMLLNTTLVFNITNTLDRNRLYNSALSGVTKNDLLYYILRALINGVSEGTVWNFIKAESPLNMSKQEKKAITKQAFNALLNRFIAQSAAPNYSKEIAAAVYDLLIQMGILHRITNLCYTNKSNTDLILVSNSAICYALISSYNDILHDIAPNISSNNNYGHLLESAIISNLIKKGYQPYFYRDEECREIDIVIRLGNKTYLIEVKSSTCADSNYLKHLKNAEIITKLVHDKPYSCYVLYQGETQIKWDFQYINIEDFLLNIDKYLK